MDAFVSPFGTGVSFAATAARALFALESNHHLPHFLGKLNPKYRIPRMAMLADTVLSIVMVSTFRSWAVLATVLSTATLIAYLTGPVTAVSLRKLGAHLYRPVRLKHLPIIAPIAFVLTSLAVYWAMWPTTVQVILIILVGLPFYFYYEWKMGFKELRQAIKPALWMFGYLIFISVMSYAGAHQFNGANWIHYPWDFLVIGIVSFGFYQWGIHSWTTTDLAAAEKVNQRVSRD